MYESDLWLLGQGLTPAGGPYRTAEPAPTPNQEERREEEEEEGVGRLGRSRRLVGDFRRSCEEELGVVSSSFLYPSFNSYLSA